MHLYAALIEAAPYLRKGEGELIVWSQQFRTIVDRMHVEDDYARYGNAPAMKVSDRAP